MRKNAKMKTRNVIIAVASVLVLTGISVAAYIGGSYYFHQKDVERVVGSIEERINQNQVEELSTTTPVNKETTTAPKDKEKTESTGNTGKTEHTYSGNKDNNSKNFSADSVDVQKLREDSLKYNEALKSNQSSKLVGEKSYSYAALDLTKYGIYDNTYGYVSAPTIGMKLPIYLGVTEGNMAYGAAHFCYTSLPTGGESTNVVLAGHTGYIGRWLFDSISNLSIGDEVDVNTYIGSLKYKVVSIKRKLPTESDDIYIERGKDKLTMVTCTYASDGTYMRYIVICER